MAQKYKVTTKEGGLNLRSTAETIDVNSANSNFILSIPKGAIVEEYGFGVIKQVDGWKYVSYNGKTGYASSQYLTPVDEDGKKQGETDKTTPVEDETKTKNYKGILIAGSIVCLIGLGLNVFM